MVACYSYGSGRGCVRRIYGHVRQPGESLLSAACNPLVRRLFARSPIATRPERSDPFSLGQIWRLLRLRRLPGTSEGGAHPPPARWGVIRGSWGFDQEKTVIVEVAVHAAGNPCRLPHV